jgi:hypothetical protein
MESIPQREEEGKEEETDLSRCDLCVALVDDFDGAGVGHLGKKTARG